MTYLELRDEIRTTGLSCTYGKYVEPPPLPYSIIIETDDNDMKADNKNYAKIRIYDIELYTKYKHPPSEQLIEDKLDELGITYSKYCTEIESEGLYEAVYSVQLI